jgi:hypothetical protein
MWSGIPLASSLPRGKIHLPGSSIQPIQKSRARTKTKAPLARGGWGDSSHDFHNHTVFSPVIEPFGGVKIQDDAAVGGRLAQDIGPQTPAAG